MNGNISKVGGLFCWLIISLLINFFNCFVWNDILAPKFNLPPFSYFEMLCVWNLIAVLFSTKMYDPHVSR